MGCGASKLDDLPAVALCRDRCAFLDEAVRHRITLAEAHVAYLHSLTAVGVSLDRFFNNHGPLLVNLPVHKKADLVEPDPPPQNNNNIPHHLQEDSGSGSDSDSGSHLHFNDSEDETGSVGSPVRHPEATGNVTTNHMKSQTVPSLIYTQNPITMHMAESSSSYDTYDGYHSYYGYPDINPDPGPEPVLQNQYQYNHYDHFSNGYQCYDARAPLPPPSPPKRTEWDFLEPFESFERYYRLYNTSSRDSREVREEEGIPDLEEEDEDEDEDIIVHDEVVKEVVDNKSGRSSNLSKPEEPEEPEVDVKEGELPSSKEGEVVDKEVVAVEETSTKDEGNAAVSKPLRGFKDDGEVVREIQLQFERASEAQTEFLMFLEVGKVQYKGKNGSSIKLNLPVVSCTSSTSRGCKNSGDQELDLSSKTLSSTLYKLYLWEKKLYEHVKDEEKIRVLYEQKSRKLKRLNEEGAEPHKIDPTRALVRSLSAKLRIAIQVVDKISVKINSLRDDELWPLLNEFIQGLTRMWRYMLECHHNQCQAISEAKRLDAIAFHNQFSDARFEATRQLQHDLINWTLRFSEWVGAQKGYVRALNNWLMKCLLYVPEETPDGIIPFSPSRIGAPPVFVVCNQWWQLLEKVSEEEVMDAMRALTSNVLQLWDRDKAEMRKRMLEDKDEGKIKSLEKEDQKLHKEILALEKRTVLSSVDENVVKLIGQVVYHRETSKVGNLQASLQRVLEAMERFADNSVKVYEELLQRVEEDQLAQEHEKAS